MTSIDNNTVDKLKTFVDRINHVSEEMDVYKADLKEIYTELKSDGYDSKIVRQIVRMLKKDKKLRDSEELMLETYKVALGL